LLLLGTYWETLWEFFGTPREPFENMVGTFWEHRNRKKSKPLKNQLLNHPQE
jgi:hypothetical protein